MMTGRLNCEGSNKEMDARNTLKLRETKEEKFVLKRDHVSREKEAHQLLGDSSEGGCVVCRWQKRPRGGGS